MTLYLIDPFIRMFFASHYSSLIHFCHNLTGLLDASKSSLSWSSCTICCIHSTWCEWSRRSDSWRPVCSWTSFSQWCGGCVQAGGIKSHLCVSVFHQAPMFSWPRLRDADPVLRCEMASTGEVSPQKIYCNVLFSTLPSDLNGQLHVSSVCLCLCFLEGGLFWTKHLHSLPEGHALHRLQATAEGHPDRDSGTSTAIWNSTCLLFPSRFLPLRPAP